MGLIATIAEAAVPEAALPLRLLTAAKGAATWLVANPMSGVALLAGVFGAIEHHEADKWAALARQRATTIAGIQTANAAAVQQATAAKETRDAYNAKIATQSDATAADLRGRYHSAVLQLAAAQDRARSADLPGDADPATGSNGPGESAAVSEGSDTDGALTVSSDDALTCADNTARLQAVHDWAVAVGQ